MTTTASRAVIYTRVSRDDTGLGKSNDRQEAECRRLTEYKRLEVVRTIADVSKSAYSGKERPGWTAVLGMIERGEVDYVIAWHMDRMTRSMLDLEHLISLCDRHGVGIATVAGDIDLTSDMGRMVARILAAVARAEVERKSARQRLANADRAAAGLPHTGGPRPFGYADDYVSLVPAEADAIRKAAQDVLAGVPLSRIVSRWDSAGLVSSRAELMNAKRGWSTRGVKAMLLNPRYAGIRIYNGREIGEATWEPIIDRDTHYALKAYLTDPARNKKGSLTGAVPQTLLSGIAVCSVCEKTVSAGGRDRHGVPTYTCRPGSHVNLTRPEADDLVLGALYARLARPDAWTLLLPEGEDGIEEAKAEAEALSKRLDDLAKAYAAGALTISQLTEGSAIIQNRLEEVQSVITEEAGLDVDLSAYLPAEGQKVDDWFDGLDLAQQRLVVAAYVSVRMLPSPKSRSIPRPPASERLEVSFRGE